MHMLPRTLWHLLVAGPRGPRIALHEVSTSWFRVWPTDIDMLMHMNNGKYLSIMDVARFDLIQRTGVLDVFRSEGWYPVVVGQTVSYRKSLNPWARFAVESRIMGFDDQAVYIEQRFVRPNESGEHEVYARAIVRGRFLRRRGAVVPIDELIERTGADRSAFDVPDDVLAWGRSTRLPSTRDAAVSVWE